MENYIIPIDNIVYDLEIGYQIKYKENNLMTFYKKNILNPVILDDNFQKWFGFYDMKRIKEGYYFLVENYSIESINNFDELEKFSVSRNKLLHSYYGTVQIFSMCLWMVKDNSASIPFGLYNNIELGSGFPMTKNIMISNSKGEYEITQFSKEEFDLASNWFNILSEYFIVEDQGREYDKYNNLNTNLNHNTNSFKRAVTYIEVARSTSFLPAKIASYISVLETLLAIKGDNTSKAAERSARLIETDSVKRYDIYSKVKEGYDVRSNYVHGSDIGNTLYKKIDQVSVNLDVVVRKVVTKIFTEHKEWDYTGSTGFNGANEKILKFLFD